MITVNESVSLKPHNTFGIESLAGQWVTLTTEKDIEALLELPAYRTCKNLVLGGGSNILLTRNLPEYLIIKNEIRGIRVIQELTESVTVEAGAGENWHAFVMHCIKNNWGGLENLSLIPGTVGAAPMQNIGAYGAEIKDYLLYVMAYDKKTGEEKLFSNQQCAFGYRESIFKKEAKDQYIITRVAFQLTKNNHQFRVSYGAIQQVLSEMKISNLTLQAVSDAVISIRKSKLPDPAVLGNAGSFFKNPEIEMREYEKIKLMHADIPGYKINDETMKIPAAWLIEQCGWKGKRVGNIGVHAQQALVIVNYSNGKGEDILSLAKQIQQSVQEKFSVALQMEVNVIA
jgi:UDP-N-acetylmuramate dehydrogenase